MKKFLILFAASTFTLVSCDSGTETKQANTMEEKTETPKVKTNDPASIMIGPFGATQEYPDAELASMNYEKGKFDFGINNYKLGEQTPDADQLMCANSGKGQHIHLIIDNEPYLAKYTSSFDHEMADGDYTVLAFLGRSYHESIKTPKAGIVQKLTVKNGSAVAATDVKEPMLFYSRPKGTYVGKKATEKVLLDFYPHNVELGKDYQVQVEVNGNLIARLDKWQSYALKGLPMGDNRVTLTLVDSNGKAIETPLNPVTRTFTLKPDPAESMEN